MIKDYVSKNSLAEFLAKIRENFSAKDHIHTKSDIADYVEVTVDTEMSSDSTNPVQNKIIKEKFDSISDQVGALANDAILSVEQRLSEEQKVQARKNIGVDSGESIVIKPNINGFFRENGTSNDTTTNYLRTDYMPLAGYNRIEYNVFVVSGTNNMATWIIFDSNKTRLASSGDINTEAYYTTSSSGTILTYGHMRATVSIDDLLYQYPTATYIVFSTNITATYKNYTNQSGVDVGWGAMEQYAKFIKDDDYGAVRYDLEQELSAEQILIARKNIGIENVSFNFNKRKYVEEFKTNNNSWDDAFADLVQYCAENNFVACADGVYSLSRPLVIGDIDVDFECSDITNNITTDACIILTGANHRVQKFGHVTGRQGVGILVNGDSTTYAYNKLHAKRIRGYVSSLAITPTNNNCWFNEYHILNMRSSQIPLRVYTQSEQTALANECYFYLGMIEGYRSEKPIKLIELTNVSRCNFYNLSIETQIADAENGAAVELTDCHNIAFFNPRIAEPFNDVQFRFIGKCYLNYIDTEYCKYSVIDGSQLRMSDLQYNIVRGAVINKNLGASTNCNTLRVYKDMIVPVTLAHLPVYVERNFDLEPASLLQNAHSIDGEPVYGIPTLYKWVSGNISINRRFIALLIQKLQIIKMSDSVGDILDENGNLIAHGTDLDLNKRYDINVVSKAYTYDDLGDDDDHVYKYLSNIVLSIDKTDCNDSILYTEQALSEEQKAQARANIGVSKPDHAQNDPSAPDYIKNRTHWAEDPVVTTETTLEETTYDGFSDGGLQTVANFTLVDGAECVVTWDGVEYTSICKKEYADGVTAFLIGNPALVESGEDNGQPFVIGIMQEYGMLMFMSNNVEATSHTVKIVSTITVQDIHKLDNKYIDAEWMAKKPVAYNAVMSVENTTVVTQQQEECFYGSFLTDCSSVLGNDIFYVTIDGVEYTSIAIDFGTDLFIVGNLNLLILGSFDGGDPYVMLVSPTAVQIYFATEGDHVVSFRVEHPVYEQLPAHYIEDALAAVKQNITGAASTIVETNLILDRALISDSSGKVAASSVTSEELGYLSGVTGNVQDQFNTQTEQTTALAKLAMPGSLKWDGFIGDKECVVVEDDGYVRMCYVHISDYDPITLSEDVGDTLEGFACVGGLMSWEIEENAIMPFEFTVNEDMSIIAEFFVFAPVDGFALEGIVFPKKGWYLMTQSSMHMGYEIPLMYINGVNIPLVNFPDSNGGGKADKYFEKIQVTTTVGDTLTWDGNTDGLLKVNTTSRIEGGTSAIYCKISDNILTSNDVVNGMKYTGLSNNVVEKTGEDAQALFEEDGSVDALIWCNIPYNNYTLDNGLLFATFPEAGIYVFEEAAPFFITVAGYNFTTTTTQEISKTEHLPEALQFGEMTKTTYSDTLTWDGDITGLEHFSDTPETAFYKVSDAILNLEDCQNGGTIVVHGINENVEQTVTVEFANYQDGIILYGTGCMAITKTLSNDSVVITPGIYFVANGQYFTKSLTINGNNFVANTATMLKTIDPKYLPEGFGGNGSGLPKVSVEDNGKFLRVVNGAPAWASIPNAEEATF